MKGMSRFRLILAAAIFSGSASAGYFELSANGSYYKYNNGVVAGDQNYTVIQRVGGGVAYRFLTNTAIELGYTESKTRESITQATSDGSIRLRSTKTSTFRILSLDLLVYLTDKKSRWRPYLRGGVGYTTRRVKVEGTQIDVLAGNVETALQMASPTIYSMSAQGGAGLSVYISEQIALEASYTAYATELDRAEIFIHYSVSGGLRYVF
jgi:opacity protein-like surface antigen